MRTPWVLISLLLGSSPHTSDLLGKEALNVVFVLSDDLSAEALSCYGNQQCKTPNIDALANSGLQLDSAYCQFPVCGPSRAALMSGMYPESIGVIGNGSSDRFTRNLGAQPTMAGLFRTQGYYTARVSKIYHMRVPGDITAGVNGPDHAASWTERFNCQAPEWMTKGVHEHLSNERLVRSPDKHYGLGFGGAFYVVKASGDGKEQPDVQAATKAIELLERHRSDSFFIAVGFVRPHVPLVAPESIFQQYPADNLSLAPDQPNDWDDIPISAISKNGPAIGLGDRPDKQRRVLAAYYASVAFMDAQLGRILRALDRLDLRKNTIVVFASDHGYHLGEHRFWQKMSLHEESTRIPLIVSFPGHRSARSDSLVEQIDVFPTLAELCGLPVPSHCQGNSFAPLWTDPKATIRNSVYCIKGNGHLLRTKSWAYIEYDDGGVELYDMKKDPRQYTNLADDLNYADTRREMKQRLQQKRATL